MRVHAAAADVTNHWKRADVDEVRGKDMIGRGVSEKPFCLIRKEGWNAEGLEGSEVETNDLHETHPVDNTGLEPVVHRHVLVTSSQSNRYHPLDYRPLRPRDLVRKLRDLPEPFAAETRTRRSSG